ncbi:MAG: hypothetical protein ACREPX_01670 [Rhodanobacteraceae bacterium]
MTAADIQAMRAGDSIIGAFDEWDDELAVEGVTRSACSTQAMIRLSRVCVVPYELFAGGPEIRGACA